MKIGWREANLYAIDQFNNSIDASNLIDLKISGADYSWSNSSHGIQRVETKIDRILVNQEFLNRFYHSFSNYFGPGLSNHKGIYLCIENVFLKRNYQTKAGQASPYCLALE